MCTVYNTQCSIHNILYSIVCIQYVVNTGVSKRSNADKKGQWKIHKSNTNKKGKKV